nr:uncharacterized protein LOC128680745 [Plodia interpunctella]
MYKFSVIALFCLASVSANDLQLGLATPHSRKLFNEIREANPALWKRTDHVTVNTNGNEVISAVYITDLREDKNGEAFIESGGVGTNTVTIGLKSPTILRGYKFAIEVFSSDPSAKFYQSNSQHTRNEQYYEDDDDAQYARKI